jgi:hypothetical protein
MLCHFPLFCYLKLMKPDGVYKIDKVENEISKERKDNQRFPAISVRYGASKQGENYPWNPLEHGTVGLEKEKSG